MKELKYILFLLLLTQISCYKRDNPLDPNNGYEPPIIEFNSYNVWRDDNGNRDYQPNPGETILMHIKLQNSGGSDVGAVNATITCNDTYIYNLSSQSLYFSYVGPPTSPAMSHTNFSFSIRSYCPNDYLAWFNILVEECETDEVWTDSFSVTIY